MIRKLILAAALACASSAALAQGPSPVWVFKDASEFGTVHLYYGEADSSDIDLELRCTPKTGEIAIRIFDPAGHANAGKPITGKLTTPGAEMQVRGTGVWEEDAEESYDEFFPGPGLARLLGQKGPLRLEVGEVTVAAPLNDSFRKRFESFVRECPIGSWS